MQIAKGTKECYIHKGGFNKYCLLKKRRVKSNSKLEVSMLLQSKFLLSQRKFKNIYFEYILHKFFEWARKYDLKIILTSN